MEKQIILFDIDGTLFDNAAFWTANFYPAAEPALGIKAEDLEANRQEYKKTLAKNTDFDPEVWFDFASQKLSLDKEKLRTVFYNKDHFFASLYPEVKPTISELYESANLGIFSEATLEWQNKKVDYMGIRNYFDHNLIFIGSDKVSEQFLDQLPNGAIIVEDKMEVVVKLRQRGTFHPIWLNRKSEVSSLPLQQITDLTQIFWQN